MLIVNQDLTSAVNLDHIERIGVNHLVKTSYDPNADDVQTLEVWGIRLVRARDDYFTEFATYNTQAEAEAEFKRLLSAADDNVNVFFLK